MVAASLLVLAATALLDYLTPPAVNFGVFYMLAVLPVAWYSGWRTAIAIAVIATALEGLNGELARAEGWETVAWNALSRVAVLSVMALITDRLQREQTDLRRVHLERTAMLRLLEREFARPLKALDWFSRVVQESLERGEVAPALRQISPLRHHVRETTFLARDLLAVGRVQAGTWEFEAHEADLRMLVDDAVIETLERARVFLPGAGAPIMVRCDADHTRHAIAIVLEHCLRQPYEPVSIFVRSTQTEAVLEVSAPGTDFGPSDLELAELLLGVSNARLVIAPRNAKRGAVVSIFLPLAVPATTSTAPLAR